MAGRVKTRLAREVGDARAAELYEAFLGDTLATCARLDGTRRVIAHAPADAAPWFAALDPGATLVAQRAGDLGARLAGAFEDTFALGATRVAAIGSDTPHLACERYREGLERVRPGAVVLGPCEDGGYWLVGLAAPAPGLFEGVEWSTPRVLEGTRARAAELGLEVELLEPAFDVDEPRDLERLASLRTAGAICPRTAALL